MAPDAVLVAAGVCVEYRTVDRLVPAVEDVDVTVVPGSLLVLAGPSGSGKSSLLRVLGLLDRPTRGTLQVEGVDVLRLGDRGRRRLRRHRLAYVHQRPVTNLVDDLNAADQVRFARVARGAGAAGDAPTRRDRSNAFDAVAILDRYGLADRAGSHPADLSGGEQQRLAIAMATAAEPAVLFADEPTASLDRHHADEVIEALVHTASEGRAVVVASHDPMLIAAGHSVLRLSEGRRVPGDD